jgi:two-component system sensor histidine kinase KdpD
VSERPDPDELLARVQADEARQRRAKLKIFFGYAAGVGKTYAMLEAARRERAQGGDVVVGYVEPHGRPETEALLEGLEVIPPLRVPYRGVTVREFDLDAALVRHPHLMLVDELAHTNAGRLRHAKRWQDVEQLLEAGIDVWTTCNVQHIESLNDVVAKISGIVMRETVPDDLFSRADEVALIDLPPEDLLERLRQGKVYIPPQAEEALRNFFQKEILVALRELALRRTAERVHADIELARAGRRARVAWETRECLLVCVGPSPTSAKVIRAAKRLAISLQAELVAVHVQGAGTDRLSHADRSRLLAHLRLAERLGAETVTLVGEDPVAETIDYARRRNVTKIVIGKSEPRRRLFWQAQTLTDRLIRDSGDIDVFVVRGAAEALPSAPVSFASRRTPARAWLATMGVLGLCTAVAWVWHWLGLTEANIVMTFLLGVVFVSARFGLWPSVAASFLAVLLFDVFFTLPYYTVAVYDTQYVVTFAVMLLVGLIIVAFTSRIQRQAELARRNERRTEALHRLSRKLAGIVGRDFLVAETERVVSQVFGAEAVVLLPQKGRLLPILGHHALFAAKATEITVAQWVFDHDQVAGRGTDTLPAAEAFYLPLSSPHGTVGVLAVRHEDPDELLLPESRSLMESYATLIAMALERDRLTLESRDAQVKAKTEETRGQ